MNFRKSFRNATEPRRLRWHGIHFIRINIFLNFFTCILLENHGNYMFIYSSVLYWNFRKRNSCISDTCWINFISTHPENDKCTIITLQVQYSATFCVHFSYRDFRQDLSIKHNLPNITPQLNIDVMLTGNLNLASLMPWSSKWQFVLNS